MLNSPEFEVIEPVPVEDIFVNRIARIEDMGAGLVRYWLCADECLHVKARVIKAKLIVPVLFAVSMTNQSATTLQHLRRAAMVGLCLTIGM